MSNEDITKEFDKIIEDHHDPEKRERKKILEIRKKREEEIKGDLGI